jgi:3-dehydroquinate synthase class II
LAVSTNSTEAQVFLEALEQGLDGVILKVEDMDDIIKLKVCLSQLFEISLVLNY